MFKISLYYNPPCPTTSSARRLHYTLLPQPGPARTYPTAKLTLQLNLPYTAPCCETYPTPQPTALQNLPYNATYPATHPAAKLTLQRNLPYTATYPTSKLTLQRSHLPYSQKGPPRHQVPPEPALHRTSLRNLPYSPTRPRLLLLPKLTLQRNWCHNAPPPCSGDAPSPSPSPLQTYPTTRPPQPNRTGTPELPR